MSKKVLITGASGFLGYHLVEEAIKQEYEVVAAVRKNSQLGQLKNFPVEFTTLDYEDHRALMKNISTHEYDYIIHAAGVTKANSQKEYELVNAEYTRNLAHAAELSEHYLRKFVYISSLAAVGPLTNPFSTITEKTIAQPVTNYGRSKLQAEMFLSTLNDLPWIVLRPTAIYGPMEKDLFLVVQSIKRGLELYIGKVNQALSFVYVKDVARAAVQALSSDVRRHTYNLSDGSRYDRYTLSAIIKNHLNKKTVAIHLPIALVEVIASILEVVYAFSDKKPALNKEKMAELIAQNWVCSISALQEDLSFTPQYTLNTGMEETISWYKRNNWI